MIIKVAKDKLVAAIITKRSEVISAHAAAVKNHAGEFADFKRKMTMELATLVVNIKSAKTIGDITKRLKYGTRLEFDKIPEAASEANTTKYDRALAQLALCSDEIITLNDKSDSGYLELIG